MHNISFGNLSTRQEESALPLKSVIRRKLSNPDQLLKNRYQLKYKRYLALWNDEELARYLVKKEFEEALKTRKKTWHKKHG
jgi:hypothetical protein